MRQNEPKTTPAEVVEKHEETLERLANGEVEEADEIVEHVAEIILKMGREES